MYEGQENGFGSREDLRQPLDTGKRLFVGGICELLELGGTYLHRVRTDHAGAALHRVGDLADLPRVVLRDSAQQRAQSARCHLQERAHDFFDRIWGPGHAQFG